MADKKPQLYTMKVDPDLLQKWKHFAKSKQMHLSDVIKRLMRGEEMPESVPVKKVQRRTYSNADPDLVFELNAIGQNVNQVSRAYNSMLKSGAIDIHEHTEQKIELRAIEQSLERLLHAHQIH